jgi:thiol-disulfide isomerase/thioredoxin
MNSSKILFLTLTIILLHKAAYPQNQQAVPLGTKSANLRLSKILNFAQTELYLYDLPGKSVLFDFGMTSCAPCVASVLLLDSLQKKFDGKLQVFMVTGEKKELVQAFLKKHPGLSVPIIPEDTLISSYFKHRYDPHEVWIDQNKLVRAYTDQTQLSYDNLDSLVKGYPLNWPVKWDIDYDIDKPLLVLNQAELSPVNSPERTIFKSVLTSNMPGGVLTSYREVTDSANHSVSIRAINYSILEFYMTAHGMSWYYEFPSSHVILETASKSKFYYDKYFGYRSAWKKHNTYCYEATMPLSLSKQQRKQKVIKDLDDYFGITVTFEKKTVPCWILTLKDRKLIGAARERKTGKDFRNFVFEMNRAFPNPPLLEEIELPTAYKESLMLPVHPNLYNDLEGLRRSLQPLGLDIITGERQIDACIVKENQPRL